MMSNASVPDLVRGNSVSPLYCCERSRVRTMQMSLAAVPTSSATTAPLHPATSKPSKQLPFVLPFAKVNPVTVSYTASISRRVRNGRFSEALRLFSQMLDSGIQPDDVTLVEIISCCAELGEGGRVLGSSLHGCTHKLGLAKRDVVVGTALVEMYAKGGRLDLARLVFDEMDLRNSVTWNAIVGGHLGQGDIEGALELFDEMPSRDVISWTLLINGLVKLGYFEEALDIFREMLVNQTLPDHVTVISAIKACANLGSVRLGLWLNRFVMGKDFEDNVRVCNAFIDMYCRCGYVDFARQVFDTMRKRSVVSWNSIIVGSAANGHFEEALQLFERMQIEGFNPDRVSYTGVLTACSHAGLVKEGAKYFSDMKEVHEIMPRIEHYGCLVDLYSRSGKLEDAINVIKEMPMAPNDVVLGSLLAACRVCNDAVLVELLTENLIRLSCHSDSNHVLLSNIYAAAGSWDGANKIRRHMKMHGIDKSPGISSVEIGSSSHEFVAGDKAHPEAGHIYRTLDLLLLDMETRGYTLS
ncbi:hypothetical protein MLD38_025305 [Melastoma candidum]|uniref:Uncharacterized protein n=1 Tax=Melastoma candidum TaxID=119954 RepID=A0ACB9P1W1_9MYRT|nr:hypothetical protein MLD38_025305 [Melastoma candidum]